MNFKNKTLRYYYWVLIEFTKKHSRMILLSFSLSFFVIISLISFSPYLDTLFFSKRRVVGMIGEYSYSNLPNEVLENISHGLVFMNEKGATIPALASSWEMLKDGKEFRFHLKQGLLWDDGKEFTAQDLTYNFKDVDVKVLDKQTIYFTLKKPLQIFPTYLTKPIVRHPLHGVVGLYRVDKIKTRQGIFKELHLAPNKKDIQPLVFKFYDTESKLINAYKTGEISEMKIFKKSLADTFSGWRNSTVSKTVDYSTALTLFFNMKNKLLEEKEVRQAIALAIPRDKLIELGESANSPVPPISWAYDKSLKKSFFDVDLAKKNLQDYTESATSSGRLNFVTFYDYLSIASDLDASFKKTGLRTNLTLANFESPQDFDLLLAYWKIPEDPDQYFFWHSTQTEGNITHYKNVKVDKLLEDGRSTLSVENRKKHYFQFQKVLVDDMPAAFLYYPYVYTIKRK